MANQNWTVEKIVTLLTTNDKAVERGIVAIHNRQTQDEKRAEHTVHNNKVGFTAADAKRGAYYARWILSGKSLTGHHLVRARRMVLKYRVQLLSIAVESAKAAPAVAVKPVVAKPAVKPVAKAVKFTAPKAPAKPVILRAANGREICNVCNVMKCPDGCCCGC